MGNIRLNCVVYGEVPVDEKIFLVDVNRDKNVLGLCKEISDKYVSISPLNLIIWKPNTSIAVNGTDGRITILNASFNPTFDFEKKLIANRLDPIDELHSHFGSNLDKSCIHAVVQLIDEKKEILCTVSNGKKKANLRWIITSEKDITLDNLKDRIINSFSPSDDMIKEYITVKNRNYGDDSSKNYFKISDDDELKKIAWSNNFQTRLDLSVETLQQAFSNWNFVQLRKTFKITTSNWLNLPQFEGQLEDTTKYEDDIKHIFEELKRRKVTLRFIPSSNEATRREFISSILHGIVYRFGGKIKIIPEYEVSGSFGRGPVDWAIMKDDKIIVITEAKREDIEHGISQNTVQLHSAIQCNARIDPSNQSSVEMYGIVTTAIEWIIIKVAKTNNTDQPIDLRVSSLTPVNLPLTETPLDEKKLLKSIERLFGSILWVFNKQFNE